MKNILAIILILFAGLQVVAQETLEEVIQLDDNEVYTIVEKKAEPKEGILGFFKNFADKFQSDSLTINGSQLNFRLKFVVEKDGTFSEITFSGDNEEAGQEAIRVLKTMPAWNPAIHNEKVVRSAFTLPVKIAVKNKSRLKRR